MPNSITPNQPNASHDFDPELAPLITAEDNEEDTITRTISTKVRLHPNLLAQLDAAFKRHHWLVQSTGVGELLDRHCRSSNKGRKKKGLDGSLYYALQMTAVFTTGQATIEQMYVIAHSLPIDTRVKFGIVEYKDKKKVRELTRKQLYTMTEGLGRNLSYTTDCLTQKERDLPAAEQATVLKNRQAQRHAVVNEIVSRLLLGTHLIDVNHGTHAIDDTSIWAWSKAPRGSRHEEGGQDRPFTDEDTHATAHATTAAAAEEPTPAAADHTPPVNDEGEGESEDNVARRDPSSWRCPDAAWGGRLDKNGNQVGIYGYKAHVIVNTKDPAHHTALPVLIQALELTPANADIVDVSLRLVDQIRQRAPFDRLIGDRHYGYKRFDRWALELWKRRIQQVLDLRADKPGAVDQYGAKVIDGRPHCPGMDAHLENLGPTPGFWTRGVITQRVAA